MFKSDFSLPSHFEVFHSKQPFESNSHNFVFHVKSMIAQNMVRIIKDFS